MLGRSRFRMLVYATTRFAHCLRDAVSRQYRHPVNAKQELIWCALEVNTGFTDDLGPHDTSKCKSLADRTRRSDDTVCVKLAEAA